MGLSVLQQFVGIDAVIYYAPTITGYSGFDSGANGSLVGAILVGAVFVFGEIVSLFLADRVGRRTLLLISNGAMFLIMAAFGAVFLTHYQKYGTVLLVLILLYVLAFAIGMGPIFWLFSAEIFPTRLRGYGSSMSATGNWAADLLVSISFLTLVATIGLSFYVLALRVLRPGVGGVHLPARPRDAGAAAGSYRRILAERSQLGVRQQGEPGKQLSADGTRVRPCRTPDGMSRSGDWKPDLRALSDDESS